MLADKKNHLTLTRPDIFERRDVGRFEEGIYGRHWCRILMRDFRRPKEWWSVWVGDYDHTEVPVSTIGWKKKIIVGGEATCNE